MDDLTLQHLEKNRELHEARVTLERKELGPGIYDPTGALWVWELDTTHNYQFGSTNNFQHLYLTEDLAWMGAFKMLHDAFPPSQKCLDDEARQHGYKAAVEGYPTATWYFRVRLVPILGV